MQSIVDIDVEPVDLMIPFDDDFGQLGVAVDERFHRFLNLIFDEPAHVEDFFAQLLKLFSVSFIGMFRRVCMSFSVNRNVR